jgi:hypothetical protein
MKRRCNRSGTIPRAEEQRKTKPDLNRMAARVQPTLKSFSYDIYQIYTSYDKYQRGDANSVGSLMGRQSLPPPDAYS